MKYKDIPNYDFESAKALIEDFNVDQETKVDCILSLSLYAVNFDNVSSLLVKSWNSENNKQIKLSILTAFSHLVRRFKELDKSSLEIVNKALIDADQEVSGRAKDVLDDWEIYSMNLGK